MTKYGESKSTFIGLAKRGAVLVMALALLVGASTSAFAASTGSWIVVKVPFEFTVGSSTLPAGSYTLTQKDNNIVQIQGEEGNVLFMASASDADKSAGRASVVFHRYGDRYFLAGLKSTDGARVVKPAPTADEERLAKAGASPKVVTIARAGR